MQAIIFLVRPADLLDLTGDMGYVWF